MKSRWPAALDRRSRRKRLRAACAWGERALVAILTQEASDKNQGNENTRSTEVEESRVEPLELRPNKEEEEFGHGTLGFPTSRRSKDYRRQTDTTASHDDLEEWFSTSHLTIGNLEKGERDGVLRMLYVWRDLFVVDVRDILTLSISTQVAKKVG